MEKCVLWYIGGKIDANLTAQHGFKSGKSTDSALSSAVNSIERSIMNKQHVLGVFLNIQGVFDNVSFNSVRDTLTNKGIDQHIIEWYMHLW